MMMSFGYVTLAAHARRGLISKIIGGCCIIISMSALGGKIVRHGTPLVAVVRSTEASASLRFLKYY